MKELNNVHIGTITQEGIEDDGIVAPPFDQGNGVIVAPQLEGTNDDNIVIDVQIESSFPEALLPGKDTLSKCFDIQPRPWTMVSRDL